jgi:hypothetical protein
MGKCEVCGKKSIFLSTYRCIICNTEVCEECLMPLVQILGELKETLITRKRYPYRGEVASVCSEKCYNKFKNLIIEELDNVPRFQPTNSRLAKIIQDSKKLKPLFSKTWENNYEISFIGSSHAVVYEPNNFVSIPKYNIQHQHLDNDKVSMNFTRGHDLENIDKKGTSLRLLLELTSYCESEYAKASKEQSSL